jgi:predicted Zn-dependent protease
MMKDISMKVNPLYSDVDLSIQFHFDFSKGDCKIGEAMVSTYPLTNSNRTFNKSSKNLFIAKVEKCAVIDLFEILSDCGEPCMNKIKQFLNVIGIKEIHSGFDLSKTSSN